MHSLRVEGLSKHFGGVNALRNVSFSVETGQHLALIGPNGAGKSTLFNVIGGNLPADGGQIFLLGQDITHIPPYRRSHLGIARSFQVAALFLELTVLSNILLALHGNLRSRFGMYRPMASYKNINDKAHQLLDSMDLWTKRDDIVEELSYGEQRRLEISIALSGEPKLLLLDEPSAGLTIAESEDIRNRINSLGSDITVILVAHDMDLVFGFAERIIVLHYGEIIAEGTCDEIRHNLRVKEIYMGSETGNTLC
jgi:branched-chain amino acid transport system ATP-binding protein